MQASEGKLGRVFMLRLEEGDAAPASIEKFAADNGIISAQVFIMAPETVAGLIAHDADGSPRLWLPAGREKMEPRDTAGAEVVIQEVLGINFRRVVDPASGQETLTRIAPSKTRVMERPAPVPVETGPGTIPVYLFNVEFN